MCSERFDIPPDEVEPTSSIGSSMHRRDFLRLGGAGMAGAILLGSASGRVLAQAGTPLKSEFQSASAKYRVPKVAAYSDGVRQHPLGMPPPDASDYDARGTTGPGHLRHHAARADPLEDTLGRAANLTGFSEEEAEDRRAANVAGGAAVLVPSRATTALQSQRLVRGGGRVRRWRALRQEVFQTLKSGASATISTGERWS